MKPTYTIDSNPPATSDEILKDNHNEAEALKPFLKSLKVAESRYFELSLIKRVS